MDIYYNRALLIVQCNTYAHWFQPRQNGNVRLFRVLFIFFPSLSGGKLYNERLEGIQELDLFVAETTTQHQAAKIDWRLCVASFHARYGMSTEWFYFTLVLWQQSVKELQARNVMMTPLLQHTINTGLQYNNCYTSCSILFACCSK